MSKPARDAREGEIDMRLPLRVYWQPGCSSCLRTKEFLTKRGVAFVSINAIAEASAFAELAELGLRRVPIVARGEYWADGQVLEDVARVAGIRFERKTLVPVRSLLQKGDAVMASAAAHVARIPEAALEEHFPGRPRSHLQLGRHVFHIFELFLDLVERGRRAEVEDYLTDGPADVVTAAALLTYGEGVRGRFSRWGGRIDDFDFAATADVYYGVPTMHEFLERTVAHAAQHTRQVENVVRDLGLPTHGALDAAALAGLDIADGVYDDRIATA